MFFWVFARSSRGGAAASKAPEGTLGQYEDLLRGYSEHFLKLSRPHFVGLPPIPQENAEWVGHRSLRRFHNRYTQKSLNSSGLFPQENAALHDACKGT